MTLGEWVAVGIAVTSPAWGFGIVYLIVRSKK